jgi:metal-sulfur cluster biosynthetic enzyme
MKGRVTVRFYGTSNGCYAEDAVLEKIEEDDFYEEEYTSPRNVYGKWEVPESNF